MAETIKSDGGKIFALSLEGMIIGIDMLLTSSHFLQCQKTYMLQLVPCNGLCRVMIGVACFLIPSENRRSDRASTNECVRFTALWFASAGIALSQFSLMVIIFSILEGMGGATILVSGITLILQNFPGEKRGAVMGFIVGTSGFGMACALYWWFLNPLF